MKKAKLQFDKWLTQSKKRDIQECISEYSRVCNIIIGQYEFSVLNGLISLARMTSPVSVKAFKLTDNTFLSFNIVREAHREAYNAIKSSMGIKPYKRPVISPEFVSIPLKSRSFKKLNNCKLFDLYLNIRSYRTNKGCKRTLNIPLKSNKYFNGMLETLSVGNTVKLTKDGVILTLKETNSAVQSTVVNDRSKETKPTGKTNCVRVPDTSTFKLVTATNRLYSGVKVSPALKRVLRSKSIIRGNTQHVSPLTQNAVNSVLVRVVTNKKENNKYKLKKEYH